MYSTDPPAIKEELIRTTLTKNVETIDFFNGVRMDQELAHIKSQIHEERELLPYLQEKEGVKENMEIFGNAIKSKSTPGKPTELSDFFRGWYMR